MKTTPLYEIKLYLGYRRSRLNDAGVRVLNSIRKPEVINEIGKFQDKHEGDTISVRITDTTFIAGSGYSENGWEVAAISYPRAAHAHEETLAFMLNLAEHLLEVFLQNRICVLDWKHNGSDQAYMLEASE